MPASARRHLAGANVSVVVGVVAAVASLVQVGPLAQGASIVGLIVLVGAAASARLELASSSLTQRLSICLGLGFLWFLIVCTLIGAVFPHLYGPRACERVDSARPFVP